ncbi:hypothetical protein MXB_3864 [Myxobolus squamalis]|nr:hypothetical protein MXB_3864 [Myxobolus squamalis]
MGEAVAAWRHFLVNTNEQKENDEPKQVETKKAEYLNMIKKILAGFQAKDPDSEPFEKRKEKAKRQITLNQNR